MASDQIRAAARTAGTMPSRARIEAAVKAIDQGLAPCPMLAMPAAPGHSKVVVRWSQQVEDEFESEVGRVAHLRTLLELAMAHLALGNAEVPHVG